MEQERLDVRNLRFWGFTAKQITANVNADDYGMGKVEYWRLKYQASVTIFLQNKEHILKESSILL